MPKPTASEAPVLALEESSTTLIAQIESNAALVPTEKLIPFYVHGDVISKRLKDLAGKVRAAILDRLSEGQVHGKEGKSRKFVIGGCEVVAEYRQSVPIIHEKAEELLRKKKLWGDAINLEIEGGGAELQKFLRKHRTALKEAGVVLREVMDEDKVKAMAEAGFITPDELKSILDLEHPPTYALKPKFKPV